MAKLERTVSGIDINTLSQRIVEGITSRSISASLEDQSYFKAGDATCIVLVFERYSIIGSNRVSLNVTLLGTADRVLVSAISSGGSEALFWKLNTFGEEAFLDVFADVLDNL